MAHFLHEGERPAEIAWDGPVVDLRKHNAELLGLGGGTPGAHHRRTGVVCAHPLVSCGENRFNSRLKLRDKADRRVEIAARVGSFQHTAMARKLLSPNPSQKRSNERVKYNDLPAIIPSSEGRELVQNETQLSTDE